jgi:hypothetical protein
MSFAATVPAPASAPHSAAAIASFLVKGLEMVLAAVKLLCVRRVLVLGSDAQQRAGMNSTQGHSYQKISFYH